jgi:hypothetical protein
VDFIPEWRRAEPWSGVSRRVAVAPRVRSSSPRECLYADGPPPIGSAPPLISASSAPASRCSLTQSPGASTPRLSQHRRFPICCLFHHERLSDGRPPLTASDPAVTATRSAPMPRCFLTSEPAPTTTSPACRRWCPSTHARHRGAPPLVSLPPLRSPKWGPLLVGVLPNQLPHHPRRRLVRIDDHCRRRRLGD